MPGYLWIMRFNRDQSGSYYWCAYCFIKFPLRFAAWIWIICNNNYAVIDWLGLTSCTPACYSLFYGESTIYKVWRLNINLLLKNEVSLVILQRNENHPTSNFFEIRKHSLILKELFKPKIHALILLLSTASILSVLVLTEPSQEAWMIWLQAWA